MKNISLSRNVTLIIVLLLVLLSSWGAQAEEEQIPVLSIPSSEIGAICDYQSIIQNWCSYCSNGTWLFGFDQPGNATIGISKWRLNSTEKAKVFGVSQSTSLPYDLYTEDAYLYFVHDEGFYRCRESGGDLTLLSAVKGTYQVTDKYIYFYDEEDGGTHYLYRLDKNGTMRKLIIEKEVYHCFVFDEAILYQDDTDGESLHVCDLNGDNDCKLNAVHSWGPIFDGTYIYYRGNTNGSDEKAYLYRMKPDGSENTVLFSADYVGKIAVYGNYIYFINYSDSSRIYRVDKNGKHLQLIVNDPYCLFLQTVNGSLIYVCDTEEPGKYCRQTYICDADGSNKNKLWDIAG